MFSITNEPKFSLARTVLWPVSRPVTALDWIPQHVNLVLKKPVIEGEYILTALRLLNWQTQRAHCSTNVSIRNVFHIIIKCTYMKKKKIPLYATCIQ